LSRASAPVGTIGLSHSYTNFLILPRYGQINAPPRGIPRTSPPVVATKPRPAANDVGDYAQLFAAVLTAIVLLVSAAGVREPISVVAILLATVTACNLIIYLYRHRGRLTARRLSDQGVVIALVLVGSLITAVVLRPQLGNSSAATPPTATGNTDDRRNPNCILQLGPRLALCRASHDHSQQRGHRHSARTWGASAAV
jgi:hypothetical protein